MILGFTTSTDFSSIALFKNGETTKPFTWTRTEQQSEALTPNISSYLKKNSVSFKDLTLIAVDKGPGSFTGSRIAVNIAKTLAFDLELPIFEVTSLDIMAYGFLENSKLGAPLTIFTILDAHRSLFYFRSYQVAVGLQFVSEKPVRALSLDAIEKLSPHEGNLFLLGNLSEDNFESLKSRIKSLYPKVSVQIPKKKDFHAPQASSLVAFAAKASAESFRTWSEVEPSYIRSPAALENLK